MTYKKSIEYGPVRHLGNKERGIWDALGDCWMKPRSAWDRDVVPYKPIFSDGWSPGVVILPDDVPDGDGRSHREHQQAMEEWQRCMYTYDVCTQHVPGFRVK